jgi:hypothetical protein
MMMPEEIRLQCLALALQMHEKNDAARVVEMARAFYIFISTAAAADSTHYDDDVPF